MHVALPPVSLTIKPCEHPTRTKGKQGNKFIYSIGLYSALLASCISRLSFAQGCKNLSTVTEVLVADQTDVGLQVLLGKIKANRKARQAKLDKIIACDQIHSAWDWRKASNLASQSSDERDLFRAMEYANRGLMLDPEFWITKRMVATAWDRILVSRGLPQWYGTPYKGKTVLPIARCVISNEIRRNLGIAAKVIPTQPEVCTDRIR